MVLKWVNWLQNDKIRSNGLERSQLGTQCKHSVHSCTIYTYMHHQIPPKCKIYPVGLPSVLYETPGHNERSVLNQVFLLLFSEKRGLMKSTVLFSEKCSLMKSAVWWKVQCFSVKSTTPWKVQHFALKSAMKSTVLFSEKCNSMQSLVLFTEKHNEKRSAFQWKVQLHEKCHFSVKGATLFSALFSKILWALGLSPSIGLSLYKRKTNKTDLSCFFFLQLPVTGIMPTLEKNREME